MHEPLPVVSRLFIYPVKSLAGIEVTVGRLDAFGLEHDRRWMVVDETGRFVTQRELPRMALVRTALEDDALVLSGPHGQALRVPLESEGARRQVEIWSSRVLATDLGDEAAHWLRRELGRPCRMVFMPRDANRAARSKAMHGTRVSFQDAYPILLLSEEAVDELHGRMTERGTAAQGHRGEGVINVQRFRPNVVVSGAGAHAEDAWRRVQIAGVELALVKPCDRCTVPAVDPATGVRGKEPLRTLATYRKRNGKVYFGMNAVHLGVGTLRVGDPVTVVESA